MREKEYSTIANWNCIAITLTILVVCALMLLYNPNIQDIDWTILKAVRSFLEPYPAYIPLFFSEFGLEHNLLWPQITVFCSLLSAQKYLKSFLFVFCSQATVLIVHSMKNFVCRERPCGDAYPGFSFPSGHSAMYTCVLGISIYLIMTSVRNKFWRYFLSILLGLYIIMVCTSRMWLSHHFPVDVLAGFSLGLMMVNVFILLCKFFKV